MVFGVCITTLISKCGFRKPAPQDGFFIGQLICYNYYKFIIIGPSMFSFSSDMSNWRLVARRMSDVW